jgi:hypothetical protein
MFNSSIYNDDIHQVLNRAISELSTKYQIVLHEKADEKKLLDKLFNLFGANTVGFDTVSELKYYCSFGFKAHHPFKILIFEKIDSYYHGKSAQRFSFQDYVIIAYKEMPVNYGDIFIRKESINDKIIELFLKQEVDLDEFPEFSSKYYVIANQRIDVVKFIDKRRADLFVENKDIDGFYVLKENGLWLINLKNLCEDEFIRTAEMMAEI